MRSLNQPARSGGEGLPNPNPHFFGILEAELLLKLPTKPTRKHSRPRRTMHTLGCAQLSPARIVKAKTPTRTHSGAHGQPTKQKDNTNE